ncbi:hypothetical protein FACS1894186_5600 [Alphaproteobacteria bacterium]|nr:hypothetical protein FACS1894186_5600 [Alphaproteobacteria bacterium]
MIRVKGFLAALLMVVAFAGRAGAADSAKETARLFTAFGVRADASAGNAEDARAAAMAGAYRRAFATVMGRIALAEDVDRLPAMKTEDYQSFVAETVVKAEKSSRLRYMATLDVAFNPKTLSAFLTRHKVPHVSAPAPTMVVLPLVSRKPQRLLWESYNPWLKMWATGAPEVYITPLIIPSASAAEAMPLETVETRDVGKILAWARSLGADGAYYTDITESPRQLEMLLYRIDDSGMTQLTRFTQAVEGGVGGSYRILADRMVAWLVKDYRSAISLVNKDAYPTDVMVQLRTPKDWPELQEKLSSMRIISRYDLRAVRNTKAQITVWTSAPAEQLEQALRRMNFDVVRLTDGVLRLEYLY